MRHSDTIMSEVDFDRLPPALRRKYFSSLERLRLAQDGPSPKSAARSHRQLQRSSSAVPFSRDRPSTVSSNTHDRLHQTLTIPRRKRKLPTFQQAVRFPTTDNQAVSEFASLPSTIQRKQFSREEQILLATRCNSIILDAADEAVLKRYQHTSPSLSSHSTTSQSELDDLDSDFTDEELEDEMQQSDLDSFRWLDDEEELDLRLDDYHTAIAATTQTRTYEPEKRRSHRRGLSLSSASFHRRSASVNSLHGQKSFALSSFPNRSATATPSNVGFPHQDRNSASSLDPAAAHYQDPAARMKLRVYLASPQKFDEAIEFGFPSLQDQKTSLAARPRTSNGAIKDDTVHTFYNDETPSLSTDAEGDREELEERDNPITPQDSIFPGHRWSHKSSSDRSQGRPQIFKASTEAYAHAPAANREMTLHMTLTRPDLRSPDDAYTARNINATPIEHAPLTVPDTVRSVWDTLPEEPSRVKRLLKRFKLR